MLGRCGSARGGALEDRPDRVDRVGLLGPLVVAVAQDAREAQRHAAGVARARCTPSKAISTTSSGRTWTTMPSREVSSSSSRSVCQASISSVMPLNVLPSITKPPVVRVARAEVEVREPALAAAVAPLGGEHDEVERVPRLDLEPAGAAAARRRTGASSALTTTPSWPRASASSRNRSASSASRGDDARHAQRLRAAARRARRSARSPGRSSRSSPSRCSTSKKNGDERRRCRAARSTSSRLPKRRAVTWNGCGPRRPVGARSPRRRGQRRRAGSAAQRLDDLGHAVGDVVERAGEHAHLVAVACAPGCAMPSSFHSTAAAPIRSSASGDVGRGLREHRLHRARPTLSPNAREAVAPSASAAAATAPRSPASISARRTVAARHARGRARRPRPSRPRARPGGARR